MLLKILILDTYPMKAPIWFSQLICEFGKNKGIVLDYINIENNISHDWKKKIFIYQKNNLIRNVFFGPNYLNNFSNTVFFLN